MFLGSEPTTGLSQSVDRLESRSAAIIASRIGVSSRVFDSRSDKSRTCRAAVRGNQVPPRESTLVGASFVERFGQHRASTSKTRCRRSAHEWRRVGLIDGCPSRPAVAPAACEVGHVSAVGKSAGPGPSSVTASRSRCGCRPTPQHSGARVIPEHCGPSCVGALPSRNPPDSDPG